MRISSALLVIALVAIPATPAPAGPDHVTGGVTVPDGRLTGGGADGGEPLRVPAAASAQATAEGAGGGAAAHAAQAEPQPEAAPETPLPEPDDQGVEVRVPVRDEPEAATAPRSSLGGLAQTGFGVAALAALGALAAAAGLGLRRLVR